jgi:hypothetical protein
MRKLAQAVLTALSSTRKFSEEMNMVNATRRFLLTTAALAIGIATGCGDDKPSTPQAAVTSTIKPGTAGSQSCTTNKAVEWKLGNGAGEDIPVKDGDSLNGAGVAVQCKVSGNDQAGYDVSAQATWTGKGSVGISGHFSGSRDPQPNITGSFIDASGLGNFHQSDCVATFTAGDQGVAAGRVWAVLTCPNAIDSGQTKACEGDSEFRFENCAQ